MSFAIPPVDCVFVHSLSPHREVAESNPVHSFGQSNSHRQTLASDIRFRSVRRLRERRRTVRTDCT
ncbi:hypothetical protein HSB1_20190 [Halogranum salarium B-1]|uniref:Uncharacterized protein n=1 Tax=Halogranum salarium B-1 TaxID=1210908 RepID=J3JG79_9EURY|nr:hypothetical protein HSB1_20190 [Halogranum salarium B-1]